MDFPLTEQDKELIRLLATKYDERGSIVRYEPIAQEMGSTRDKMVTAFHRLERLKLLSGFTNEGMRVLPALVTIAHQIDNPPPKDHWEVLVTWFRSKRWSLPLVAIVVLFPIFAQWMEWICKAIAFFWGQGEQK